MNDLNSLFEYSEQLNLKKTITNYLFSFDNNIVYNDFYTYLIQELNNKNKFDSLLIELGELEILEIKYCNTNKTNIKTFTFLNHNNIDDTDNNKRKKEKNINIRIIDGSINSKKIENYLYNCKTSLDQYFKKKKIRNKSSIYLFKQNTNENSKYIQDSMFKNNIEINYNNKNNEKITKTILNIYIENEKIICYGRMLLPNCISIILKNRSILNIYKNNKLQILPVKNDNDIQFFKKIYKIIQNIINKMYNVDISYTNEKFHCDFNYFNKDIKLPILIESEKNLSFFGKDKINIRNIKNTDQLKLCFEIIKKNIIQTEYIYNEILCSNPFTDEETKIFNIINLLNY
jgi:hypothetical protein